MAQTVTITPLTRANLPAVAATCSGLVKGGAKYFTIEAQDSSGKPIDPGEVPFPWRVSHFETNVIGDALRITVWHSGGEQNFTEIVLQEENRLGPAANLVPYTSQAFLDTSESGFVLRTKGVRVPTLEEAPINDRNRRPILYDIRFVFCRTP